MPLFLLGLALAGVLAVLAVPRWRKNARWILPGFKEAHLSRFSSALALDAQNRLRLEERAGLLRQMESGTKMGDELARWESRLAEGAPKFADLGANSKVVPPLFFWLVAGQGEDFELGLTQAAQMYYDRAVVSERSFPPNGVAGEHPGLGIYHPGATLFHDPFSLWRGYLPAAGVFRMSMLAQMAISLSDAGV
jgi:hypothetical protein